jgi:hypothetical protein
MVLPLFNCLTAAFVFSIRARHTPHSPLATAPGVALAISRFADVVESLRSCLPPSGRPQESRQPNTLSSRPGQTPCHLAWPSPSVPSGQGLAICLRGLTLGPCLARSTRARFRPALKMLRAVTFALRCHQHTTQTGLPWWDCPEWDRGSTPTASF